MLTGMSGGCDDGALSTHIVFSELVNGDLRFHEVVVEDDDLPAEGSLFLLVVLGLQKGRKLKDDWAYDNKRKELWVLR